MYSDQPRLAFRDFALLAEQVAAQEEKATGGMGSVHFFGRGSS
jgi:hypothetical protein